MARTPPTPKKPATFVRSLILTQDTNDFIKQLSQDASDRLGWTVSSSAVVRALIRYAEHHAARIPEALFPLIEQEIDAGMVWGSKKK